MEQANRAGEARQAKAHRRTGGSRLGELELMVGDMDRPDKIGSDDILHVLKHQCSAFLTGAT